MKTIFIIYYNLDIGGIQRKIADIINYIDAHKKGVRVVLILKSKNKRAHLERYIHHIDRIKIYRYYESRFSKFPFCFSLFAMALARQYKPTEILSFSLMPSLAALCIKLCINRNTRVIITEEAAPRLYEIQHKFKTMKRWIYACLYRYADILFTVNTTHQKELAELTHVPLQNIRVISNWIQLASLPPKRKAKKTRYDLLYIGRLDPVKQVHIVIHAVETLRKIYPHIRACIVGAGTQEKRLQTYVKTHHLSRVITFTGFSYTPELYIQQAKIFLFPSANEGMPFALLEAMSYGLPIVCNNFPSAEEVVMHGKTGYIYTNQKEMIYHLSQLLEHPHLRASIGRQGIQYAQKNYGKNNIRAYIQAMRL